MEPRPTKTLFQMRHMEMSNSNRVPHPKKSARSRRTIQTQLQLTFLIHQSKLDDRPGIPRHKIPATLKSATPEPVQPRLKSLRLQVIQKILWAVGRTHLPIPSTS